MEISPDNIVYWQSGIITLNATILFTWLVMAFLVVVAWLVTHNLSANPKISQWQSLLEIIVEGIANQIHEVSQQEPKEYIGFIGTLFLFIAVSNTLAIVPGYQPPTGSLSTTTALALCVFVAVPLFGIMKRGVIGYLRNYIQPTVFMLPFNIIGEFSRTLALAVRLFGNIMSGTMLVGILLSLVPLFFPIVMQALGLVFGLIQAYVFAMLAMVYIASATSTQRQTQKQ
ncbi:MAG: F0F1 ATP synthase subunit A [Calothrix sp. MO_167.B42]|nr:F0F1 ATP synthase subunit A [Calothrix sp. MO_167.B42]